MIESCQNIPKNWPANGIECHLENILNKIDVFIKNPNYKNKEILVSLVSAHDLNQYSELGLFRTTEYEVSIINSLYFNATIIQLNTLKVFLYELIRNKTKMQKVLSDIPESGRDINIEEFKYLMPQLQLHYITYQKFIIEKRKSYAEQLIEVVERNINGKSDEENIVNITRAYITLLNDISYFRCTKRTKIWAFTKEEIYKLYSLAAKLIKLSGDIPTERPLKGVLMTSIGNYILKSRNNYNEDYICKYISPEVAKQSIRNHQIWMMDIKYLNDIREQKVISEIFEKNVWSNYPWAKNIDLSSKRKYYVSSFCKALNNSEMAKKYGECIYGYKDDHIAEIISPITYFREKEGDPVPMFSQVLSFDVIYDEDEAKNELEFLFSIIECFDMTNQNKKNFLEEILQYWILSVKYPKWSYERERRYVLFMYDNYQYNEIDLSVSQVLKLKTSLLLTPDFILGKNPVKNYITRMINEKRTIYAKPYLFCLSCLNRDFDEVAGNRIPKKCSICGSTNTVIGRR